MIRFGIERSIDFAEWNGEALRSELSELVSEVDNGVVLLFGDVGCLHTQELSVTQGV